MISIVCIDDQREVLNALCNDLEEFSGTFDIIECESAEEAWEVLEEIDTEGDQVGLIICDQVMPEKSGVEFLEELVQDPRFSYTRKIMLTGLATHQDTIQAINLGRINAYIEKPWDPAYLLDTVKKLMTEYVIQSGTDYREFMEILDQQVLYEELRKRC